MIRYKAKLRRLTSSVALDKPAQIIMIFLNTHPTVAWASFPFCCSILGERFGAEKALFHWKKKQYRRFVFFKRKMRHDIDTVVW